MSFTNENTTSSSTQISNILTSVSYSDANGGSSGIAVTAKTGNGIWQYSTDNSTWTPFGTVTGTSSLLLDSNSYVRYVPDGQNGETTTFTFRGWNQTSGSASSNGSPSTADTSTNGGTTAFSTSTANASLTVTSVNDAPVVDLSGGSAGNDNTASFSEGGGAVFGISN